MPRPTNKKQLLDLSQKNFDTLNACVDSFSEEERNQDFPKGTMNRNIRDVLAHLHAWHAMMMQWYAVGMKGQNPDIPAPGYTWKTTPELNHKIWDENRAVPLSKVRKLLNKSHADLQKIIGAHTDAELFEKKRYHWTGSTSLGAYFVSATSSHYDWALKVIKKAKKKAPTRP